jgi:hypothetical protein
MNQINAIPTAVRDAFQGIDQPHRDILLNLREMIFEVAAEDDQIGQIEETLRWGEPAYITQKKKTGSTIRLAIEKASGTPAVFFNCKTTLVEEFREKFGGSLSYVKNRAVLLDGEGETFEAALKICIAAALSYHLRR